MILKQEIRLIVCGVFLSFAFLVFLGVTAPQLARADFVCEAYGTRVSDEVACNHDCPDACVPVGRSGGSVATPPSSAPASTPAPSRTPSRTAPGVNRFANENTPYPHNVADQIPRGGPISDVDSFLYILTAIIEFAEAIFWILAVGFGLYGAYLYLFSQGNSEKAGQARKIFIYAAIASLLAIVSYGIPGLVESFVLGY